MSDKLETVGVHRIILPIRPKYLLADGQELASEYIFPDLISGIQKGQASLLILIPEQLHSFTDEGRSTIMAEFYVGLLEDMIRKFRDDLFPKLKPQAKRDKMFIVGESVDGLEGLFNNMFHTSWVTYDPLEQFLYQKINIGLLHQDNSITLARFECNRTFTCDHPNESIQNRLFGFCYKYYKSLDWMFDSNLEATKNLEEFMRQSEQQPKSTPAP